MDFKKVAKISSGVAAITALAVPAFAVDLITVDYATAATGLVSQATGAVTAAMPILGGILGVVLGIRLFKRFAK